MAEENKAEVNKPKKKTIFKKVNHKIKESYKKPASFWFIFCAVWGLVMEFALEVLSRRSIIAAGLFVINSPLVFLYNFLIIFFTLTVGLLFRKRAFLLALISVLWITAGVTNFVVLGYRITPFSAIDLLMVSDVFSMLDIYFNPLQQILLFVALGLAVVLIVIAFIKIPKVKKGNVHFIANVIVCLVSFLAVYVMTILGIKTKLISDAFANLPSAYSDYGFVYCFTNSIIDNGVSKPDNYNEDTARELYSKIVETDQKIPLSQRPDVIIIQMESFFDINRTNDMHTDIDPIANFNKFKEEYPSGYLTVPAVGSGTANTEFEMLTGMKSKIFGAGEYPYKTVLTSTPIESLAYLFSNYGYSTHAMHNNKAKFYSRDETYANMGFDSFTSLEYMIDPTFTETGWAKDEVLVPEIMKTLEATRNKDFIFCVSVQGHGRYPKDELKCEEHVKLTRDDGDPELTNQFGYFVNQTYEMDQVVAELKRQLDERNKPYVLVLYGDHIPALTFSDGEISVGEDDQTEYVIINNIGITKKGNDKDIIAYEFPDRLLTLMRKRKGVAELLHQKLYDENDTSEFEYAMQFLQYDMLYGDKYIYDYIPEYKRVDMTMGLKEYKIVLTSAEYDDKGLTLKGENFTPYSVVIINNKRQTTEYIDKNTIRVDSSNLKGDVESGTEIVVGQIDKDDHELSRTNMLIFEKDKK